MGDFIMKSGFALLAVLSLGLVGACGNKDGASTTGANGTASAAAKKKGKTPSPANKKADAGKAKKGGDNKDAKPAADSKKAGDKTINAAEKKKADAAETGDKDPCADLPDGTAECHESTILFCKDKAMWQADCNAIAKDAGAESGACFEAEKETDCMLCGNAEGVGNVCCDSAMSICCTDAGDCFQPDTSKEE